MTAILQALLKLALPIFAGWGIGKAADKVLPDKVPYYPPEGVSENLTPKKLIWLIILAAVAGIALKFIGKKFNIKLLK